MKTKRAFAFLLALCMAVSLLHVGVLAEDETEWERLRELLSSTEGTVTLTQSYTAAAGDRSLEVPGETTVTLDLNGHTIDGSALETLETPETLETNDVLIVYGALTLKDSAGGGKLVGSDDGAIYVGDGGKCTVSGGAITAKNAAHGAVSVGSGAAFTVSGAPAIGSVYLGSGAVITVGGALTWTTPLPVKTEDTPTDKVPVIITSGLPEGGRDEQFISVDPDYAVYTNARSGEAELRPSQTDENIIVGNNYPVTLGNTYAFIPEDDGTYIFYSVGEMDTVGTLYLGEDEITNDDDSGEGNNFRISAFLNAGSMCRLCVRGKSDDDNGKTCTVVVEYRAVQKISFASTTQEKTYGDADFTVTATGAKTSVSYQVTEGEAATVDSATGAVHIVKAGTATITATAEETNAYTSATASYTLTVDPKTVTIPTAATGLKWTGNEQTGVVAGTGYTVANSKATAVGSYTATATLTSTTNYKWSDNTTAAKSIAWSIAKADGPAAPTGLTGVAPTTDGGSDGKITGVTTEMEYSADGSSYTACSGTEITGLSAGTYYVRYQETATHEAGAAATVQVPAYTPPTVSGSFDGSGKLVATVTAPKDSVLIAVSYASSGKMTDTKTYEVTAAVNNGTHTFDTLAMASGNTYKIMLVDKTTYAPLCAAWGN